MSKMSIRIQFKLKSFILTERTKQCVWKITSIFEILGENDHFMIIHSNEIIFKNEEFLHSYTECVRFQS